jgi:hypothetical protein
MLKVIKEYEVYEYKELSEEAKEVAFKKIEISIVDSRFEFLESDFQEDIYYQYGIVAKLNYDLSYSQGDGLSFVTDTLITLPFVAVVKEELRLKKLPEGTIDSVIQLMKDSKIEASTKITNHRYAYASKNQVTVTYRGYEDYQELTVEDIQSLKLNAKSEADIEAFFQVLEDCIAESYIKICKDYEKIGYAVYQVSEEDIIDYCQAYGITFYESGIIFNE